MTNLEYANLFAERFPGHVDGVAAYVTIEHRNGAYVAVIDMEGILTYKNRFDTWEGDVPDEEGCETFDEQIAWEIEYVVERITGLLICERAGI